MRLIAAVMLAVVLIASPCLAGFGAGGFPPPAPGDGSNLAAGRAMLGLCLAEPGRYLDGVESCLGKAQGGEGAWKEFGLSLPDGERGYLNSLVVPSLGVWEPGEARLLSYSGLGWETALVVRLGLAVEAPGR